MNWHALYIEKESEILDFNRPRTTNLLTVQECCTATMCDLLMLSHWQTDCILNKINGVEAEANSDVNNSIMGA